MTPTEQLEEHFSNIQFPGRPITPEQQRRSAMVVVALCRRQTAALFWIANQVFGPRRGALPLSDLQRIAGAAARGEDWELARDVLAERRAEARAAQLRRG
ncbi:MAG TPA: hypothetical protein VGF99_08400 [Myxococcota bacterium]